MEGKHTVSSSDTSDAKPPFPEEATHSSGSESENPAIRSPEPKAHRPLTNQDWWPEQIDVTKLHAHSSKGNPLGEDFDYASEFAKLDPEALNHVAGLVAGRLRQLCRSVHPDELARRRHLPHL